MKLALVVVVSLAASPAFAYVRSTNVNGMPLHWGTNEVTLESPPAPPPGMSIYDANAIIDAAAATWQVPTCSVLRFATVAPSGAPPMAANDMHPQFIVRTDKWCNGSTCYDPQQLAVTTVFARAADGVIVDADVELNAVNHQWTSIPEGGANPKPGAVDLGNVVTHELGHFLGLSENCVMNQVGPAPLDGNGMPAPACASAPAELREGTMFPDTVPDDTQKRTLSKDDEDGICAIYPRYAPAPDAGEFDAGITISLDDGGPFFPPPTPPAKSSGGCSVGGAPASGWSLALLALVARRRRRGSG